MSRDVRGGVEGAVAVEARAGVRELSVVPPIPEATVRLPRWVVPLMLVLVDLVALLVSVVATLALAGSPTHNYVLVAAYILLLIPAWLLGLKLARLYDRDNRLIGHSTVDEVGDLARVSLLFAIFVLV